MKIFWLSNDYLINCGQESAVMIRKIYMLISFILLISIQSCYAQTYTSEDYNFKITFPEGWEIKESNVSDGFYITATTKNNNNDIGLILLEPEVANFATEGTTPDNMSELDRKYVIDSMTQTVRTKYPNGQITYSGYQHFGGHGFVVVKKIIHGNGIDYRLTFTSTFIGGMMYSMVLVSSGGETYTGAFSDVLTSFSTLY